MTDWITQAKLHAKKPVPAPDMTVLEALRVLRANGMVMEQIAVEPDYLDVHMAGGGQHSVVASKNMSANFFLDAGHNAAEATMNALHEFSQETWG